MVTKRLPIGIDKIADVMSDNYYFVDKTGFLRRVIDNVGKGSALLITRPRRFGKTLTLDMVRAFFDCRASEEERGYFANLQIAQAGERYLAEQNRYPVLFLSFGAIKPTSWESFCRAMSRYLGNLCNQFGFLLEGDVCSTYDQAMFRSWCTIGADIDIFQGMLSSLSQILYRYYGQPVILLIDEYDAPLQAAHDNGYYQQAVGFMRDFFCDGLKMNRHLKFALLTGVLRISRESIFSGLNNLTVDTVLDERYADIFGFTPEEAEELLQYYGHGDKCEELKLWYDGYRFGNRDMYNPWSVLNFVASGCAQARPFWLNTSSNDIMLEACQQLEASDKRILRALLSGDPVVTKLNMELTYGEDWSNKESVCGLLVTAGYLKAEPHRELQGYYLVRIPNREIGEVYAKEVIRRSERQLKQDCLTDLLACLQLGDSSQFSTMLRDFIFRSCSYYDDATPGEPRLESFYHGLVLGLTAGLGSEYYIKSNLESGIGRSDLLFIPKDATVKALPVLAMEFKRALPGQDLATLAQQALQQAQEHRYGEDWATRRRVFRFGLAFRGKELAMCQDV